MKYFEIPEIEITKFEIADVLTTSEVEVKDPNMGPIT